MIWVVTTNQNTELGIWLNSAQLLHSALCKHDVKMTLIKHKFCKHTHINMITRCKSSAFLLMQFWTLQISSTSSQQKSEFEWVWFPPDGRKSTNYLGWIQRGSIETTGCRQMNVFAASAMWLDCVSGTSPSPETTPCLALRRWSLSQRRPRRCIAQRGSCATGGILNESPAWAPNSHRAAPNNVLISPYK